MRAIFAAAVRYRSSSAGSTASASALVSKPAACASGGSSDVGSISIPSRSRTALAYSVRLSRWRPAGRPGLGCAARRAVQFRLQPRGYGVVGGVVRPRHARRRHRPASQLDDHFLPRVGRVGDLLRISLIEQEVRGLRVARCDTSRNNWSPVRAREWRSLFLPERVVDGVCGVLACTDHAASEPTAPSHATQTQAVSSRRMFTDTCSVPDRVSRASDRRRARAADPHPPCCRGHRRADRRTRMPPATA